MGSTISSGCSKRSGTACAPENTSVRRESRSTRLSAQDSTQQSLCPLEQLASYVQGLPINEKAEIWRTVHEYTLIKEDCVIDIPKDIATSTCEIRDLIRECAIRHATSEGMQGDSLLDFQENVFAMLAQYMLSRYVLIDCWKFANQTDYFYGMLKDCQKQSLAVSDYVEKTDKEILHNRTRCIVNHWMTPYQVVVPPELIQLITCFYVQQEQNEVRCLVSALIPFIQKRLTSPSKEHIWNHAVTRRNEQRERVPTHTANKARQFDRLVRDCVVIFVKYKNRESRGFKYKEAAPIAKPIARYLFTTFQTLKKEDFVNDKDHFCNMLEDYLSSAT